MQNIDSVLFYDKALPEDTCVKLRNFLKSLKQRICGGDFDFLKKSYPEHYYSTEIYNDILSFIDSLEVKEVDLEKEIKLYKMRNPIIGHREESLNDYMSNVAKHFFELGLKKVELKKK